MRSFVISSIVFFVLVLNVIVVSGLRCRCDFCPKSKNNTCETNGYCLSLTWLQRETNTVHHAYRCLHIQGTLSREPPAHCNLTNVPNVELKTACCSTDMCNLHLTPALELSRDFYSDGWDYRQRPPTGTVLSNTNNGTRDRGRGYQRSFNFVNSTEQENE